MAEKDYEVKGTSGKTLGTFKTREEAEQFISDNNLEQQFYETLPEVVVAAKAPKKSKHFWETPQFQDVFGSGNPIWGSDRVRGVRRAWQRNPEYMQSMADAQAVGAAVALSPFAVQAAGEYVAPWLVENVLPYLTARGWLAATEAAGNTPAWLTPTTATAIDAGLIAAPTGASVADMVENGPSVSNVTGTVLGAMALGAEAAPTIVEGIDAAKAVYNNGTLWDRYTTLGGRLGYWGDNLLQRGIGTMQRRFNIGTPKPHMPELIRAEKRGIDFHPEARSEGRFPWINTTTTRPVIDHQNGAWKGSDVIIMDPGVISDPYRYLSTDPMDTFITGLVAPGKGRATVISGDPEVLRKAKAVGYETLSSPKLRQLFQAKQAKEEFINSVQTLPLKERIKYPFHIERTQEAADYTNEIVRLTSTRGMPTMQDYAYQASQTGLPMRVFNLGEEIPGTAVGNNLQFVATPPVESRFRNSIQMNQHGKYPKNTPPYTDIELQKIARLPQDLFVPGFDEWNSTVIRYLTGRPFANGKFITPEVLSEAADELGVSQRLVDRVLNTPSINAFTPIYRNFEIDMPSLKIPQYRTKDLVTNQK